ncbi:hypothetical protein MVEN_01151600 [Mycena venus]|uniref:protein S-acyltransferase n=1 Tax=Mycena venus TaxID=2733690 RepID=A0A8H6Y3S6_9AGAR|nr:hypothetical protein MVEN_01151600 [Mycena venus]
MPDQLFVGEAAGGYLYAAVTPVSIFGSLGAAKAAFTIVFISLPFGSRILKYVGFEPKGDVVASAMLDTDSDRYLAETRVLQLLDKYYIRTAQRVSVERPAVTPQLIPLRPWDLSLLVASLFVACLGVLPYVHFSVLHHSPFPALAIFFPFCRVIGGLLCVFPGQLLLQYRIQKIIKQRLLFKGINDILNEHNTKIPIHHLLWDESHSSEACLSSLVDFLSRSKTTRFVKHVALLFGPESGSKDVANGIKAYLANTWQWLALICALLLGFVMTIVGYIGCFTIVQSSSVPSDTYIWLGTEAALAFLRLLIWGLNPSWDDSDGICLAPTGGIAPLPAVTPTWVVTDNKRWTMYKIISETEFWQALTAYSGPIDIDRGRFRGSERWYSWIETEKAGLQLVCVIAEGQDTVLCWLDDKQEMKFYHADINFNPGHVVRKEELKKDHELLKVETNFKLDILRHFHFVISTKDRVRGTVGPIKASWPLSDSWVTSVVVDDSVSQPRDVVHGGQTGKLPEMEWGQLVENLDKILTGMELGYKEIATTSGILSHTASSRDLHERLSDHLFSHTEKICTRAPYADDQLKNYYNENWEMYSEGILYLDRVIDSPTTNRAKGERQKKPLDIDTVANVAMKHWKSHVLQKLQPRLRWLTTGLDTEVHRVLGLFTSEDWTRADFWNMKIKSRQDPTALESASADGRTEIVRQLLEGKSLKRVQQYSKALQAASSSGHIAVVRLLREKGADINAVDVPVLQTASSSSQIDVVRVLLESGADVNGLGGKYGSALQAASYSGHIEIARFLLVNGADVNAFSGKYSTALQVASERGNLTIVEFLLENLAEVNAFSGKYGNALQAASCEGHQEIARLLLEKDADVNAIGGKYGTALHAASERGNLAMARLLLEKGADVNAFVKEYGTALGVASERGNLTIVQLLLENCAKVNTSGGKYGNALQAASCEDHQEIARLLLEKGADVNAFGGKYGTALHAASERGNLATVRLLLEKGADVNSFVEEYGTALGVASERGNLTIVQLLLENRAEVNTSGGKCGGALQAASYEDHQEIVCLLLEKGADVNALGGKYGTALQVASERGNLAILAENMALPCTLHRRGGNLAMARLLLENGANVNTFVEEYGTALGVASERGNLTIVQLLLENCAKVNISGGKYGGALQAASYEDHQEIVCLLLEKGANVNACGRKYGTALQFASERGNLAMARLLIQEGADVNAFGGNYGTALQLASERDDLAMVRLLIQEGADVNAFGGNYGTALQLASERGNLVMARLFLQKGAHVNAFGGKYGTALQAASYEGHQGIALLLLNKGAEVNISGGKYGSALHAASSRGGDDIGMVWLLVESGANVNIPGPNGSALDAAYRHHNPYIADFLRGKGAC